MVYRFTYAECNSVQLDEISPYLFTRVHEHLQQIEALIYSYNEVVLLTDAANIFFQFTFSV